jgi:exoribonuclease R
MYNKIHMNLYRVVILDRNYSNHIFYHVDDLQKGEINVDSIPGMKELRPLEHKMFMDDIFEFPVDNSGVVSIVRSAVRKSKQIAGVLMLENNKTFGRTVNKKRLLYKCIPDDVHLPAFLVPYEVKVGFSKVQKNKFVTFQFDNWNDKHPHGLLTETIGDVDNMDCFFEYQLYCKSLHISLTDFTKKTSVALKQQSQDEYIESIYQNSKFHIEDHRDKYVFTIDPENSTDFDDGFNIEPERNEAEIQTGWKVTVYIANVFFWLETLGLWNSFSKRVSTIYLPDRRRPMLPTILSDTLCSLQEKQDRFALAMEFHVSFDGKINTKQFNYKNTLIRVKKNYRYEESRLLNLSNTRYHNLLEISKLMDKSIKDSHDVVAHWMIQMNAYTGLKMLENKIGIFRSVLFTNKDNESQPDTYKHIPGLSDDASRVIKLWNNTTGKYIVYNDNDEIKHDLINNKTFDNHGKCKFASQPYIHITSPIRRLIDLLNQIILFREYSLVDYISDDANSFFDRWINDMDYINATMRSIRKVQTDCNVLQQCIDRPEYMKQSHVGIVFDKMVKTNGLYSYMVYLDNLKILSRITCQHNITNYSRQSFNMFLFEDEHSYKKKIRLQWIEL